jgi:hypothetical protein
LLQLVELFFDKLIVFYVSTFVESCLELFFTRAYFNTPKGVSMCVWLEIFGIIDYMLITSYFGTKFGPIMYNFKPVLKNLMRKRSSHSLSSSRHCNMLWGRFMYERVLPREGHQMPFCHKNFHFSAKNIKCFYKKN